MAYLEPFEQAAEHVRAHGVKVEFERGSPLAASAIERACKKSVIPIPASLAEFYAEVGDGLRFHWRHGDAFAIHEVPKLEDCVIESFDNVNWRTEWKDDYDFSGTRDPVLAKQTALKMRKWLLFVGLGNGDIICLDTAVDPVSVVFDQHDWLDGGTGANGHRLADSLLQFYTDWARVCFQSPRNLWWPSVFKKDGPFVDWSSDQFLEPFRMPGGR